MNILVHLLFPHQTNNHKAKIIHPSGLSLVLCFVLVFQLLVRGVGIANPQVLGFAANISPSEVIRLTNEKRAQNGLAPVNYNAALSAAAQAKASHMINLSYWAHIAPDGTQPWKFFGDAGYKYKYAGENLARDFSNPSSAVDAWMASSSHRENLLSSKYKDIGVAVIDGQLSGVETTIIVQMFGTRAGDVLPTQPVAVNTQAPPTTATAKPTARSTQRPQATVQPSATPTQVPILAQVQPTATATPIGTPRVLISPFNVTRGASSVIVSVLLIVLIVDMVIISRRRIARVSGRSFAHFAFFAMILAVIIIMKAGRII
ncbi:MAG: CAP domain-containing protein [Patescibacteria group bacterium]